MYSMSIYYISYIMRWFPTIDAYTKIWMVSPDIFSYRWPKGVRFQHCWELLFQGIVCRSCEFLFLIRHSFMEVWKIIFLSKWVICRFHVHLPGCMFWDLRSNIQVSQEYGHTSDPERRPEQSPLSCRTKTACLSVGIWSSAICWILSNNVYLVGGLKHIRQNGHLPQNRCDNKKNYWVATTIHHLVI